MKKKFIAGMATTALLTLASCGGDSGSASTSSGSDSNTLQGVAATGAPIANGFVVLKDKSGKSSVQVSTDSEGAYSVNIEGLSTPLLVKVTSQNGESFLSIASDEDVKAKKKVNISPLSHIIVSNVIGKGDAQQGFDSFTSVAANITKDKIESQKTALKEKLRGVFQALSVDDDIDILNGELKAGTSQGMDKVLDALNVEVSSGTAEIKTKMGTTIFSDDLTDEEDDVTPADVSTEVSSSVSMLSEIKTFMNKIASDINALEDGATDSTSIQNAHDMMEDHLHPDFLSEGFNRTQDAWHWVCDDLDYSNAPNFTVSDCGKLHDEGNFSLTNINIIKINDANDNNDLSDTGDYVVIRYDLLVNGKFDEVETDVLALDNGKWKIYGDQSAVDISFNPVSNFKVDVNTSTQTVAKKYNAAINTYISNNSGFQSGDKIVINGPAMSNVEFTYDGSYWKYPSQECINDNGSYGPVNGSTGFCDDNYNGNSNNYFLTESQLATLKNLNEYTFAVTKGGSSAGTFTEYIPKPILLSETSLKDFLDDSMTGEKFVTTYCGSSPMSISGKLPSGVEIDYVSIHRYFTTLNESRSFNGNDLEITGTFNETFTYANGDSTPAEVASYQNYYFWIENNRDQTLVFTLNCDQ